MTTSYYPSSVAPFTTKVNFVTTVDAGDVNSLQLEVDSLEANIGTYITTGSGWIGSFDTTTTTWDTLKDRIANIEYGLYDVFTAVPAGGSTGQVLTKSSNNDYAASWTTINALPSQTGNSGYYLTTDGTSASWAPANTNADNFSQFLLSGC